MSPPIRELKVSHPAALLANRISMHLATQTLTDAESTPWLSKHAQLAHRHIHLAQNLLQLGGVEDSLDGFALRDANPENDDQLDGSTTGVFKQGRLVWEAFNDWLRAMYWVFDETDGEFAVGVGQEREDEEAGILVFRPRIYLPLDEVDTSYLRSSLYDLQREMAGTLKVLAHLAQGQADGREEEYTYKNRQALRGHIEQAYDAVMYLRMVKDWVTKAFHEDENESRVAEEASQSAGENAPADNDTESESESDDENASGAPINRIVWTPKDSIEETAFRALFRAKLRLALNQIMNLPLLHTTTTTQRDEHNVAEGFPGLESSEDTDSILKLMSTYPQATWRQINEALGAWTRSQWEEFEWALSYGKADAEDSTVRGIIVEETLNVVCQEILFRRAIAAAIAQAKTLIKDHGPYRRARAQATAHLQARTLSKEDREYHNAETKARVREQIFGNPATRRRYIEKYAGADDLEPWTEREEKARMAKKRKLNDGALVEAEARIRRMEFNERLEGVSEERTKQLELRLGLDSVLEEVAVLDDDGALQVEEDDAGLGWEEDRRRTRRLFMAFMKRAFMRVLFFDN
ncbi:uncharacterized protein DSM5745_03944 [Aspergillus mulundensis]|uniref:Uncharacterized protein n=1 Tax=Aspergillus mulundensis TaxID=1810919 RepID=A0A3D8SCX4_9EURO|nr:hypothetical protein DSM5745_03944 [Aspergillus mulundensis]RDW83618.1 hypothetical protein DSM5745_03944 [Aspergillus mulundensis]